MPLAHPSRRLWEGYNKLYQRSSFALSTVAAQMNLQPMQDLFPMQIIIMMMAEQEPFLIPQVNAVGRQWAVHILAPRPSLTTVHHIRSTSMIPILSKFPILSHHRGTLSSSRLILLITPRFRNLHNILEIQTKY
jgi:hypothetical protein